MNEKEAKQVLDFGIKDTVSKKEMKQLLKHGEKKVEKKENFFISLLKKFQFRKYRKHNKKIINHRTGV